MSLSILIFYLSLIFHAAWSISFVLLSWANEIDIKTLTVCINYLSTQDIKEGGS